ncbi:relaxase/mobilization nuclease domain-containing protein (plasmid) [Agrobacterium rosae]|uniref:relaxase/mobilization nuclease domain-containing protein n=1 Tax=Agrobacterium rosae TaxID=1972867 RepID=UPI002A0B8CF7|nr:relaxase/mobilization nuclease domain-containing protein [Agrobacterium rosae]MDX8317226.1 relaxase/mobilization nuclease domain-containing protein [Agrobacterium rosae]
MVPDVAGTGHSFKGAFAYYLHDKRANDALPQLASSERVGWTETRNLATDDMHTAQRVMIATAKQADELKARAGVKATGRKSTKSVYAYSLSWSPDEAATLTRDEMVRAADASLKLLGAENRQAVIVCHTDQKHPHVHVIVNRVDPEDGRMLDGKNDHFKLSDWANEYERERGRVLTPRREEKRQQREQHPDKEKRREYIKQKRAAAKEQTHDPKTRAVMLRELGANQKVQHRDQWRDLAAREKTGRDQIYRASAATIAETIERHKAECKPIWAEHYRGKRAAERKFNQREKSVSGIVVNAWSAARHQQSTGQLNDRGLLTATLANVFSSKAREQAFLQAQELTRQQLASRLKSIGDKEVADLKGQRSQDLAKHRDLFQTERGTLIERQDGDRAKLREAWKQLYGDRSDWSRRQSDGRATKPYKASSQRSAEREGDQQRNADLAPHARGIDRRDYFAARDKAFAERAERFDGPAARAHVPAPPEKQQPNVSGVARPELTSRPFNRAAEYEALKSKSSPPADNRPEPQNRPFDRAAAYEAMKNKAPPPSDKRPEPQAAPENRPVGQQAVTPKVPRVIGNRHAAEDEAQKRADAEKAASRQKPDRGDRFDWS